MKPSETSESSARVIPLVKALALPVVGICLSYALVLARPNWHKRADAQARLNKLSSAIESGATQHETNQRKLTEVQQKQRSATRLVTTVNEPPQALTPASTIPAEQPPGSTMARLAQVLSIFGRHGLNCLASQPVSIEAESTPGSKDNRAGAIAKPASNSVSRRAGPLEVTLLGRFSAMQDALAELHTTLPEVSILVLEMQPASAGEVEHRWILHLEIL